MTTGEILKRIDARLELGALNADVQLALVALKEVLWNQEQTELRLAVLQTRLAKAEAKLAPAGLRR